MKNLLSISFLLLVITSCTQGQSTIINELEKNLSAGKLSISDILTNSAYMDLHPEDSFRKLIKKYAMQEKIRLITEKEPGMHIRVRGKISNKNKMPLGNTLVYIYYTDNKGWYADTAGHVSGMGGDRMHARLFGYLRTMNDGSFEFSTIHPQGYPHSDLPQHIHFEVFSNNDQALLITELLFDDDKRLTAAMRQRMIDEGAFIATGKIVNGEQLYNYEITTP